MPAPFGKGFGSIQAQATRPVIDQGKATYGKYAGKTFDWLLDNAPRYLVTLYEKHASHGMTREQYRIAKLAVEQRDEERRDEEYNGDPDYDWNDFWSGQ